MVEVVYERCCGLDIHKQTVVACLIVPGSGSTPHKEIRTFGTLTDELLELGDWLAAAACTHVAMESTGVYWKLLQPAGGQLRTAAGQRAPHQAASRKRGSYLRAQYHRLAARRGKKKALVAVGHTILVIAYRLLTDQTEYRDLGSLYFDQRDEQRVTRRLVHRLEALGYTVNLDRPAA